jgi:hypothetical protein
MPEEPPPATLDTELTTNTVATFVRHNQIGVDQVPVPISTVPDLRPSPASANRQEKARASGHPPSDPSINSQRLCRLLGMRLARQDAQTASRYQP